MTSSELYHRLVEIEHLGGGTSIYKFDGFISGYRVLVKQESYLPLVELFNVPPCTQDGLRVLLQTKGLSPNTAWTIARTVYREEEGKVEIEKGRKKGEDELMIRMMIESRSQSAVVFVIQNEKLKTAYIVEPRDVELEGPKLVKIDFSLLSIPQGEDSVIPVLEVDFSQIQRNPDGGRVLITTFFPRTEFNLQREDINTL